MDILSLRNSLRTVKDTLFKISFIIGRPLNDPSFFEIAPQEQDSNSIITKKTGSIISKAGQAFQRAANKAITNKSLTGDLTPKPTIKIVSAIATEGVLALGKTLPYVSRISTPQTLLYTAFLGCTLLALSDETTRNTITDSFSQLTSAFQSKPNENPSLNEIKLLKNNIT